MTITIASAQPVNIPDPQLALIIPNDQASLQLMTTVHIENSNIQDLTGLEHAVNLERLYGYDNSISNINMLAPLTKLFVINLHENNIQDISVISNFPDLAVLLLNDNSISDISSLTNLHNLVGIDLRGNTLNSQAYTTHIPQILSNNPDMLFLYDAPIPEPGTISLLSLGCIALIKRRKISLKTS